MRFLIFVILISCFSFAFSLYDTQFSSDNSVNAETYSDSTCYAESKAFQENLNHEFKNKEHSPLTKKDRRRFKTLDFFEIDPAYCVVSSFEVTPDQPVFEMPTTTERKPKYKKYGEATFVLDSDTLTVNIYQNQGLIEKPGYEDYLFLPFKDLTNGKESYGGGRYLDLRIPKGTTIMLNFNKAYNPYCAYNHHYSCPIPPRENHLDIAIPAGVKAFKEH